MLKYALQLATTFILVHALGFVSLAQQRAEEIPTPVEIRQARETSALFMKRLEETGDFSRVVEELFVEDFIWRYVQEQKQSLKTSDSSATFSFALGLDCKQDLLTQATTQDWQRLYVANYNFFYHVLVSGLNQSANKLLKGEELDDDAIEKLLPTEVSSLLDADPILKNLLESKGDAKAIETLEEVRSVSETLEEGLRLLLASQNSQAKHLTKEAKQVLEQFQLTDFSESRLEISDKEAFFYPAGTRMLLVMTPVLLGLKLVEVDGKQKIVWVEVFAGV